MTIEEQAADFIRWRKQRRRSDGQHRSWREGHRSFKNHTTGVDTLMANGRRLRGALKDFAWKEDA